MSRDELLYHVDIKGSCEKVLKFTAGITLKDFAHDDLHYDAVLRNLEIIGKAVKHIPEERRQKNLQVKWRKIAGLRDIVAHHYFGVSDEIVWDIFENEIPALLKQVDMLVSKE